MYHIRVYGIKYACGIEQRYFIAFEAQSRFVKDCVGGDTKGDAEERDVDDGTDDMQAT